jgi:hypothetical protein
MKVLVENTRPPDQKRSKQKRSLRLKTVSAVLAFSTFALCLFTFSSINAILSDVFISNHQLVILPPGAPKPINSAVVTVTEPAVGQTPSTTATAENVSYSCGNAVWNPSDDPFTTGVAYTVTVTLTASSTSAFTDVLRTATINGHAATVTNNTGSQVTLSYTFAPILVVSFSAQTAFCTAANNQTPGRVYHVAAPADAATTFTLNTKTTTSSASGALVTNVNTIPGASFSYTNANGILTVSLTADKAQIHIPAGFIGDVAVSIHAEQDFTHKVDFTLVIRSIGETIANVSIPTTTPWNANLHNAVFVAGDWEWRVLDRELGSGFYKEALIVSMHTHDTFQSPYYSAAAAPAYQTSVVRSHAIAQYNNNPVFAWAHGYSVEPVKTSWTQTTFAATTLETVSSGTLTRDFGNNYDGCFLLSRNDLSIQSRGVTSVGHGVNTNQYTTAQPSRQFTMIDGSALPDFGGNDPNTHINVRTHYSAAVSQELNSNGGWGTGNTNASRNRYYLPAMIIRYGTWVDAVAVTLTEPVAGQTPSTTATAGNVNYSCGNAVWSPNHDPFTTGVAYTVTVTLTASSTSAFTDVLRTATINGHAATVTNNTGSQVTLSYTFAPDGGETPEPDPTPAPTPAPTPMPRPEPEPMLPQTPMPAPAPLLTTEPEPTPGSEPGIPSLPVDQDTNPIESPQAVESNTNELNDEF